MRYQLPSHFLLHTVLLCALTSCGGGTSATADNVSEPAVSVPVPPGTLPDEEPAQDTTAAAQFPSAEAHANAVLTYALIDAPNGTFGYDVFSDGQLLLHQTNVPGQPGVEGCKTKAEAEKLAAFVIGKIKNGQMPPTVETAELKSLGIIN